MNLEELQSIRDTERQTDSLQSLRGEFYAEAAGYIEDLRAEREALAAESDDPFADSEIRQLSDEIATAERTFEAIYERRIGKLVKQASFQAADMPTDDEALTDTERDLYTDLVDRIIAHREQVLALLDSSSDPDIDPSHQDAGSPEPTTGSNPDTPVPPVSDPDQPPSAEMDDPIEEPPADDADGTDGDTGVPRTTVRISADVGEIVGVDERTYELATDDIVTLPAPNAEPLLERDAAERLE